ncbi:MAG TPA: hypothetical protein VJN43_02700 [Bryobacteraceae bacterium]|nr:hypothetical protein [Bryobacteraceae bacterium]
MRVLILGDSPAAKALRGHLARHDFHLTSYQPDATVRIEEQPDAARPMLDGIHCELEQAILRHLRKQTATPIEIHTAGGVESDREVRIVVPATDEERRAVEVAVFRALLDMSGQSIRGSQKRAWWRSWISRKSQ